MERARSGSDLPVASMRPSMIVGAKMTTAPTGDSDDSSGSPTSQPSQPPAPSSAPSEISNSLAARNTCNTPSNAIDTTNQPKVRRTRCSMLTRLSNATPRPRQTIGNTYRPRPTVQRSDVSSPRPTGPTTLTYTDSESKTPSTMKSIPKSSPARSARIGFNTGSPCTTLNLVEGSTSSCVRRISPDEARRRDAAFLALDGTHTKYLAGA